MTRHLRHDDALLSDATNLIAPLGSMPHNAASPPIFQTSSFLFDSYDALADVFAGRSEAYIYSRGANPTVRELETLMARLERTETARGFASGMAAIAAAVLPLVRQGDRIVTVKNLYSDAFRLFEEVLARFGVRTDYVDGTDTEAMIAALPGARVVYLESPTSMAFSTQDIAAICAAARGAGVTSVVDNSWATPLYQKPALLGADLVVHAASKYLSGHSDTLGGIVAGPEALLGGADHEGIHLLGGRMAPFDAWLILRGMRTLRLRMRQHMEGGVMLARALEADQRVTRVRHPAVEVGPGVAGFSGFGGLFAADLAPGLDIRRFTDALEVFRIGVSWGGPESLVVPAQAALQLAGPHNVFHRFGIGPETVRFAVGHEDPRALVADVRQALERAA